MSNVDKGWEWTPDGREHRLRSIRHCPLAVVEDPEDGGQVGDLQRGPDDPGEVAQTQLTGRWASTSSRNRTWTSSTLLRNEMSWTTKVATVTSSRCWKSTAMSCSSAAIGRCCSHFRPCRQCLRDLIQALSAVYVPGKTSDCLQWTRTALMELLAGRFERGLPLQRLLSPISILP